MNIVLEIDYRDPKLLIWANLVPKLKCVQRLQILRKLFKIQNVTQNSRFEQIWPYVTK